MELIQSRSGYREWKELASLIGRIPCRIQKKEGRSYLVSSKPVRKDRYFILDTALLPPEPLPLNFLPDWSRALHGLKWGDGGNLKKEAGFRDGVAGLLSRQSARDFFTAERTRFQRLTGYRYPDETPIPEDLYLLQMSRSGRLFFVNSRLRVFLYSIEKEQFLDIGGFSNFMNFCVHSFVEGRDWYLDGYALQADTFYYDILKI